MELLFGRSHMTQITVQVGLGLDLMEASVTSAPHGTELEAGWIRNSTQLVQTINNLAGHPTDIRPSQAKFDVHRRGASDSTHKPDSPKPSDRRHG